MKNIPDITVLQHLERGSPHIKFRDTVQPLYIKMAGLITAYLPYIIILQTNTVIIRPPHFRKPKVGISLSFVRQSG